MDSTRIWTRLSNSSIMAAINCSSFHNINPMNRKWFDIKGSILVNWQALRMWTIHQLMSGSVRFLSFCICLIKTKLKFLSHIFSSFSEFVRILKSWRQCLMGGTNLEGVLADWWRKKGKKLWGEGGRMHFLPPLSAVSGSCCRITRFKWDTTHISSWIFFFFFNLTLSLELFKFFF